MSDLLRRILACDICKLHLPAGPRPIVQFSKLSRILIIGQAPGKRVHESGVPWDDPSGKRLRAWLQVNESLFYDKNQIALVPMGFCYPGKGKSGDLPPRTECYTTWHNELVSSLEHVQLTLLIGQYAQEAYLDNTDSNTLTETVRNFRNYLPAKIPLPHPSPRNNIWLKKNPWFEKELLPELRARVKSSLSF
ncbi:MAG: uracil-DNA glycosylase family protein [Cyclobacteriaceae bacterium]|nr:uracil-DNA glycosylase family protein [Cyclobacteriaceae bacterium HetDA_MAG_MS6]